MLFCGYAKANDIISRCYGATHNGFIKDAAQLPDQGRNFRVFSKLAWYLGRTFVHSQVSRVILESYSEIAAEYPQSLFMYAETGWPIGGAFKPHKTHQNGLSVDFMVPVVNEDNKFVYLPVSVENKWGYDIEFNEKGEYKSYRIDFEVMGEHLKLLYENSQAQEFSIKRVYFDPRLQPLLFSTRHGKFIQTHIKFNTQQAWVRHDEHYHVDFDIRCLALK